MIITTGQLGDLSDSLLVDFPLVLESLNVACG